MDEKMKLIIDCDPGIDDTLALMYAIKSNKFDILILEFVYQYYCKIT